jgi:predicted DNA-binding transcriptional regulator AlpA
MTDDRQDWVLVPFEGLAALGIMFSRIHLRRLIASGKFPAPVKPSEGRIAWRSDHLRTWLVGLPTGRIPKPRRKTRAVAKARAAKKRHKVAA